MTESPSRNLPPKPPAPPAPPVATSMTQRNSTQMLQNPRVGSPAGNAPPPPPAGQLPVAPPPMAAPRPAVPATSKPPAGLTLAQIVQEAFDQGYSDVHLGIGEIPRFRNQGEIQTTNYPETDKATFINWLHEIMTDAEIQRFQDNLEFDGATQYEFARVRINVFDSLRGYAMVLRLIPLKILSIDQLRLPPIFRDICHYHKGLILVTGPSGSGKSTTMAAMVDYINREMPKHIITIEDPIEFVHQSRKSLVKQREVGMHTRKFDNALKAALREDPDLILVGEMRDKETVNTALKAAQTGNLVMGTLHTNSAVKTIERILNLYSGEEQDAMRLALSESLVAVIAQGLCRTTDGKRTAFHDILINTEAIKEWIKDAKYDEIGDLMKQAGFDGMITMNQSLFNLYQEGRITEETAIEMSPTPNEMMQFLRGRV
ncbi:type IV pilus twitching motility protein PilT [Sphaerospermopsis torques-reginae]|uniref:Type IV pilus twitching motility protein PilT n=1 Tax=Sphaerospermopsis torques-reginae ITEP-024 TaxID=984208 RepID=A0ABX8WUX2_9CYAN|nr:type IV pilus twitching motility protein PilT [Sphaerospermopsis torques-reginae]QYX30189.1 type IV pilus twitching motility protein PilT [Sphaerospermopsis torques-reginae ITEP-024]